MSARRDTGFALFMPDRHGECILLTDGCWTATANVHGERLAQDIANYGVALYKPRLFKTKRAAHLFARARHSYTPVVVRRWTQL